MEKLLEQQATLLNHMGNFITNTDRVAKDKHNDGYIQARIELLQKYWEKYQAIHDTIVSQAAAKDLQREYFTENHFVNAEIAYCECYGTLKERLKKLKSNATDSSSQLEIAGTSISQSSLPKINLNRFDGELREWPPFHDLFKSLIDSNSSLTGSQKLYYLKTSLCGQAEQLLRNIAITDANYPAAFKLLVDRYQNERLLVTSYLKLLTSLAPMKSESAEELRKLSDGTIEAIKGLESLKRPVDQWDDWLVFTTVQKLDPTTRKDWENSLDSNTKLPSFETLCSFLQHRLNTLEAMGTSPPRPKEGSKPSHPKFSTKSWQVKAHVATKSGKSPKCSGKHLLFFCPSFRQQTVNQRRSFVLKEHLCFNCLRPSHSAANCPSENRCRHCNHQHHSMLHSQQDPASSNSMACSPSNCGESRGHPHSLPVTDQAPSLTMPLISTSKPITTLSTNLLRIPQTILLATARVVLRSPAGRTMQGRALIDQGSQATFISSFVASHLQLDRVKVNIPVKGIGTTDGEVVKSIASIVIQSRTNPEVTIDALALVLPKLAKVSGLQKIQIEDLPHLHGLELADPSFAINDSIDLIIGADLYHTIIQEGLRKGMPTAQKTSLVWILSGPARPIESDEVDGVTKYAYHINGAFNSEHLDTLLQKFWEIEELAVPKPILSDEDQACETYYKENVRRSSSGRYIVRLPIRKGYQNSVTFGDSRTAAVRSLQSLERRFESSPQLKESYLAFMHEYSKLEHMELISHEAHTTSSSLFYLPHHGVINENSALKKLRVVFNGSRKSKNGYSLNDYLAVGPKLQPDLASIVLRWRRYSVVLVADIRMMYRQIQVDVRDCELQRIVWRTDPSEPVQDFRLLTVTYGTTCAPYLAIRTLQQLAIDEEVNYPLGSQILRQNLYVDDALFGADNVLTAIHAQRELIQILNAGGFQLHKWASNSIECLQNIDTISSPSLLNLSKDETVKTLGLWWNPKTDCFEFKIKLYEVPAVITKRNLLSDVAKLYDPLGFLSPTIILAKYMFQRLWLLKIDWDEPLPTGIREEWLSYRKDLPNLSKISIPRWIGHHPTSLSYELHGFSDASEIAYSAVIYFRATHDFDNVQTTLLCSKTKLAPLKKLSIPRLELMGAHLLIKLMQNIQSSMEMQGIPVYCWTDSLTALAWVTGHPSKWKTFVANRVSEILQLMPSVKWRYVPSICNPADCASRGVLPSKLGDLSLWWEGPPWLKTSSTTWPQHPAVHNCVPETDLEQRRLVTSYAAASSPIALNSEINSLQSTAYYNANTTPSNTELPPWDLIARYSSLQRLFRLTAWCRRFVVNCRTAKDRRASGNLSPLELKQSMNFWIQYDQQPLFPDEYRHLSSHRQISNRSSIIRLTPFFDFDTKTIRVGGRLQNSELSDDSKHQFLIAKTSPLAELIIADAHTRTLHGGVQLTLSFVRQQYWILGSRDLVRHFLRRCVICFRQRATAKNQLMGILPSERVQPSRPFNHSGLDYAGPILVRYGPGRGRAAHKAYIALFVCMATKAIHVELVSDLTTEAFIAAYKRFTARRGLCSKIFSDNATTFVSAAKNLRNSFSALGNELPAELASLLSLHGTEWHFIPPNAPNFGGLWEAGVKSVKHHLKRCIGTSTLTFEELYTLLTQIEACVNSRPLYHLSPDPNDLEPLTPGHFLIGSSLLTTPEPTLQHEPQNRLSRWKLVQQTYEHFWNRWSKDYLNTLQERTKWKQPSLNLQPGHLIVLREDHLPPSSWALGRIVKVHPGSDGLVRVVSVQTKDRVLQRPITKICLLPISDNRYDNTQQVPSGRAAASTSSHVIHQPSTFFRLSDEAGGDV